MEFGREEAAEYRATILDRLETEERLGPELYELLGAVTWTYLEADDGRDGHRADVWADLISAIRETR